MTEAGSRPGRFRRVLVTGGTGFVGGHLCPGLRAAYPDAQRLLLTRTGDPIARPGFDLAEVDLTNAAQIAAVVARFRPDLIVHLAAQASIGDAAASQADTWRINFGATFHLAEALARYAPEATFFFVSSAEVYGASFRDGPADEATVPRPLNAYARAKFAAEMALADTLPDTATLIVARAFNHTGPGQDARFVLPAFAAQIASIEAGRSPPMLRVGNLDAERDFLDVRDVCNAYLALIETTPARGRVLVNVSSGHTHRIGDLLLTLQGMATKPFDVVPDPERMRPSDIPRSVGRCDTLVRATGWQPTRGMAETLQDVLDEQRRLIPTPIPTPLR